MRRVFAAAPFMNLKEGFRVYFPPRAGADAQTISAWFEAKFGEVGCYTMSPCFVVVFLIFFAFHFVLPEVGSNEIHILYLCTLVDFSFR